MRLTRVVLGKLIAGVLFSTLPAMAFAQAEVEPNDSKAQATPITLPAVTTAGVITGNSVSATTTGLDYFRVTTATQATPGFYRHRLIATTTGTAGHTLTIRGLDQAAGVPGTADVTHQTSQTTSTPARFVQWYTSQAPGTLFVRATGVAATTADYSLNYEVTPVTEIVGPTIQPGSRTITSVGQTGASQTDTDLWVYDSNRAAIPGFGNDDEFNGPTLGSTLTRTYASGVFHMGISNFQMANNQPSPVDDDFRTGTLMDFPGVIANSSTTTNLNVGTTIDGVAVPATKVGIFDMVFVQFSVGAPPPTINAGDASIAEGNSGTTDLLMPVTLSAAAAGPVTVNFATANGTATAGSDYTATSGTLTFAPGTTTRNVTVSITGDTAIEADETFFVNLSGAVGGTIGDNQGLGTITNDDFAAISVGDASVVEGNTGTVDLLAPVTLSQPSPSQVTVAFATADDTATAGSDYTATSGVLTFAPGTTALNVTVSVIGDTTVEANETFFVNLSAPTNATILDGQGLETITDDDAAVADENAELSHGFRVNGSLFSAGGVADTDVYPISQKPYSSYEVVVDAASGDVSPVALERLDATSSVIQTSLPISTTGTARSLRCQNITSEVIEDQTVRVSSGGCTTECGVDDVYRLRAYETTGAIPRFNNSGTQITVLLLQNPTDYTINTNVNFWSPTGTLLHTEIVPMTPKQVFVVITSGIPALNGASGSVTISHDGRYGDLAGKTVALEPATGFSFDSPLITRRR
jgi:hypothetical protein